MPASVQQVFKEVINRNHCLFVIVLLLLHAHIAGAQNSDLPTKPDTTGSDSLNFKPKNEVKISKNALESQVKYLAHDSMRFEVDSQRVYLYGKAEVYFEDIALKSEFIRVDLKKNLLFAHGLPDSTGKIIGNPLFTQGDQEFKAVKMTYNYKTKKGKIHDVRTKQDEGFLHGDQVKKDSSDNFYMRRGKYTTCEHDTPHFYFSLRKVKVIKDKQIVTGPADLVVAGVPTPLAVPFGFFPNKKGRSNGLILPRPFNSDGLGFGLEELGYYWGINDKLDMTFSVDAYSRGSYRGRVRTGYAVRYKYSGSIGVSYANIKQGERGFPNYALNRDIRFTWLHDQDARARPDSRFSASVNAGKVSNIASRDIAGYVQNTFASNINYTKIFLGTPFSFNATASQDQNAATRSMNLNLPTFTLNMTGINPLGNKWTIGKPKFITDLRLVYAADFRNVITTTDTGFIRDIRNRLDKVMRNGLRQDVSLSTNFRLFRNLIVTPAANYNEAWYLKTINRRVVKAGENDSLVTDTISGFRAARTLRINTTVRTNIYGYYLFKKGFIQGFRHLMIPSVTYTYQPTITGADSYEFNGKTVSYSPFETSIYGAPPVNKQSTATFALSNNLQMKYKLPGDTTGEAKKITLLDAFNLSSVYNLRADSMKLSPLNINARTILFNNININYTAVVDPYYVDVNSGKKRALWEYDVTGKWARLTSSALNIGFTLKPPQAKKPVTSDKATPEELEKINAERDAYIDFNIPWNLSVFYNISYNKPAYVGSYVQTISVNGDLSITPKWKLQFSSGYDFTAKDVIIPNFNLYRDLHCWEMRINVIPYGPRKMYTVDINVRASVLQDLKLSRKKDWYDLR
ncbi:MAG: putative LPS assembly protein LptD [Bacteroidota bacterium]